MQILLPQKKNHFILESSISIIHLDFNPGESKYQI